MPLGDGLTPLDVALVALQTSNRTRKWTARAVLGLFCDLHQWMYHNDFSPRGLTPTWEIAEEQVEQLIANVAAYCPRPTKAELTSGASLMTPEELAAWCVQAVFSKELRKVKTKNLAFLSNGAICEQWGVVGVALGLRAERMEELEEMAFMKAVIEEARELKQSRD